MTTKTLLSAAAFSAALLASGVGYAADGFEARLQEAQAAVNSYNSVIADRSDRESAVINLNVAESYHRAGNDAKAQQFLNFARSELGLNIAPARVASPVVAQPGTASAGNAGFDGIVGLRPEAH